ncbi:MAG: 4Fe-4S dicluster domain-containing protein [bacterium]|nr:4Fe-4S dicluster domain-containing protein [bacterium]
MLPREARALPGRTDPAWAPVIETASGERVGLCFGCGICTGSCPLAPAMDMLPSRLMKAVQLGLKERVLKATAPYLCVGCETCAVRCPNGIDVARVMDAVRQAGLARGGPVPRVDIQRFHQWFLRTVRLFGRAHEGLLSAGFSLQQGRLREDLPTGWALMRHGRLALWPHFIRRRREVRRLFRAIGQRGGR